MKGEVPGFIPPEILPKTPEIEKPKFKKEYIVPAAFATMIATALGACAKEPTEPTVIPGNAVVEHERREKPEWTSGVYDLLKSEIKNPERLISFEAILEDEALRHLQNKFSSPEDKRSGKYVLYSNKIEDFFGSLKNPKVKRQIYDLFKKYCQEQHVPIELAIAVAANETGISPQLGIMQVEEGTAKNMGISPARLKTLEGHIEAGVKTLAEYHEKFGHQWGVAIAAYNGGSGDIFNFLEKHGHVTGDQKFQYAGDNAIGFYKGNIPDIASMYLKAYGDKGKSKPALGYVFRVIAMSQILRTINWDKRNEPLKVDITKLWRPELWKQLNKPEKKKQNNKNKPAPKHKKKQQLPVSQVDSKNHQVWARR